MDGGAKQDQTIVTAKQGFAGSFRMRHHADHVAVRVGDTGGGPPGTIGLRIPRYPADRCEARAGAAAQAVTVGAAAREDNEREAVDTVLAMNDVADRSLGHVEKRVGAIPVTPGAGEDHNPGPQADASPVATGSPTGSS